MLNALILKIKSTVFQSIIALNFTFVFISEKLLLLLKKRRKTFLPIVEDGGQGTGVFNLF